MNNETFAVVSSLVIFVIVMLIYSKETIDNSAVIMILAVIACLITGSVFNASFSDFLDHIEFEAIIFIISMSIIVSYGEKNHLFQWIAVKVIHFTKGDHIKFFYLICFMAAIASSIISDITVILIFIPLIIRACKILKIDPTPYLFGMSFTINVGSIYTPFSSSENVLISASLGLDFVWFIKNLLITLVPFVLFTLLLIKRKFLNNIEPPEEVRKQILLEIMSPNLVVLNKKKFKINAIGLIVVIFFLIIIPYAFIVALIGSIIISLINKEKSYFEKLKEVDWKLMMLLIAMFLLLGTMDINGTFDILGEKVGKILHENVLLAAITVLVLISIFSGFLAQVPTALLFISLLGRVYPDGVPTIIIIAFILGINIGSNFLPQGAIGDLISLNIAKKNGVEGFNYNSLLKEGSKMTTFHILNSIIYLTIYAAITGVI